MAATGPGNVPVAWLVLTPIATAILAFVGAWLGNRAADGRSRSEEAMRMLRWGVELALDPGEDRAVMGWRVIGALSTARWVDGRDAAFLDAVTVEELAGTLEELPTQPDDTSVQVESGEEV